MVTTALFILGPALLALTLAIAIRPRAAGWVLAAAGGLLLAHAGVTMLLIWKNGGLDPGYEWMNAWMLFATIPAGTMLLIAAGTFALVRRRFQ